MIIIIGNLAVFVTTGRLRVCIIQIRITGLDILTAR